MRRVALSPREAEVLAAVSRHRTNAEIAAELFLSVRTVESHVSSLLRKLDAADRRELAARAAAWSLESGTTGNARLVGRDHDLDRLAELLEAPGLVTVVGVGGVGKTSLVRSLDTAVVVDLATLPVGSGAQLTAAAALAALGHAVPTGRTPLEALTTEAVRRQARLVLDNCEHVLEGAAVVAEKLTTESGLRLVATSRERLGVPGERVMTLEPLTVDAALDLFVRRAAELQPPVELGPGERDTARRVCAAVDGLPLAVELAAARLGQLGLDDLAEAVGAGIDVLDGGAGSRPRHRSVTAMLDWSYRLLGPPDQAVHRRLSVLVGPFPVATANAVAGGGRPVAAAVARLVDASLLVRVGTDRYRQLELVRSHAGDLLASGGERDEAVSALLAWAGEVVTAGSSSDDVADLRAAAREAERLPDGRGAGLLRRLAAYWTEQGAWEDAMGGWERAARSGADPRDALAAAELALSRWQGDEAWRLYDLATAMAGDAEPVVGLWALEGQIELVERFPAITATERVDPEVLRDLLERARRVDFGDDLVGAGLVACAEAWVAAAAGDLAGAREAAGRAVATARAADEPILESAAWDAMSGAAVNEGDAAAVHRVAEERLQLRERLGASPRGELERSDVDTMAVDGSLAVGRFAEARQRAELLLVRERERGLAHVGLGRLSTSEFHLGLFDQALAHASEAIGAWEEAGEGAAGYLLTPVCGCVAICGYRSLPDDEARWLEVAERIRGVRGPASDVPLMQALRADVHLFHGRPDQAAAELRRSPWDVPGIHRSTYAAVTAAVLGGEAVRDAERLVLGNRNAAAIVARARGDLEEALELFSGCDAAFEVARTRALLAPDGPRQDLESFLTAAPSPGL